MATQYCGGSDISLSELKVNVTIRNVGGMLWNSALSGARELKYLIRDELEHGWQDVTSISFALGLGQLVSVPFV